MFRFDFNFITKGCYLLKSTRIRRFVIRIFSQIFKINFSNDFTYILMQFMNQIKANQKKSLYKNKLLIEKKSFV